MRHYHNSVVWCLTDSGPESLVADARDVTKQYLDALAENGHHDFIPTVDEDRDFLYPNAMRGPGWQHMWDHIVKAVVMGVEFYPNSRRARRSSAAS